MLMRSKGQRVFQVFNVLFLVTTALLCIAPMIHVLAVSFSSSIAAGAGYVKLWPVDFTIKSYGFVLNKPEFLKSFFVSFQRVLLGVPVNMLLTIVAAYPLAKSVESFKWRTFYTWVFLLTMLFSGGLIPLYMVVTGTKLTNTIWALILPGAVPVFNVILLMNFFRELPKEIEDAAFIDGAGHWRTLWKICVPLSTPALATLTLFVLVNHWNAWFDGIIFMNRPEKYPLQSYLRTIIVNVQSGMLTQEERQRLLTVDERTSKAAQIFIATIPVLLVYPYLQKYFTTGLVLGSVKG